MDYDKWEDVLIQWINCLKVSEPIHKLESLRNGEFFSKLLHILGTTNSSITNDNCLTASLKLIKAQYPNYIFDEDYLTELHTASISDIVTICSLLLHFACVVERKDSLIIPSCKKLPPNIQINIKNFLEKVNTKITNFHFKKIIDEMNESNISSTSYQWMPVGDSPFVGKSPLQEFLRSPSGRPSKLEKDKEIKKLRSELEIERFEKADLQEELKEHKEEIKRLGNQIKEKGTQMSKLRSELYALENKTPPHNKKTTSFDIERQLKIEIQTLEQYVDQLQTKHDDLQEENINISDKLRNSTKELKIWQLTTQSLELNNKELSEKYSKQEIELENLKVQCAELSGILEEVRSSNKGNDSSMFFSPNKSKRRSVNDNGTVFEDLAHTIVDVQLKDAQKENVELKHLLKESVDKENVLQSELEDTKRSYENLSKKCACFEEERNGLSQKIAELTEAYEKLDQLKRQIKKEADQLSISNSEKDSAISSLQSELESSTSLCNHHITLSQNLTGELEEIKSELKNCQSLVVEKDGLYENLQREANLLQAQYHVSIEKFNTTNFDLEKLKENYEQFERTLEKSLGKLEHIVYGYNNMKFDDNFLDNIGIKIENDKNNTDKEIKDLKRSVSDYEELVNVFKREINSLRDEEKISLEERENLKKLLDITEASMGKLQTTIEEQDVEIKEKTGKIVELMGIITELTKLEGVIQSKDAEISDLRRTIEEKDVEIERYAIEEGGLKETVQFLNDNLTNKDEEIGELRNKNSVLNQRLLDLEEKNDELISEHARKMMEQEKMYLEKIHVNSLKIQECTIRMEELETDLQLLKQDLDLKSTELADVQHAKCIMEETNAKAAENLQEKIVITEDTIKKLQIELSIVQSERGNLQVDVNNLHCDHHKLVSEKKRLLDDAESLKSQIKSMFEKLCSAEEACSRKDTVISQNNKDLLNMKLDLESKKQEYKNLQSQVEKLNGEAGSYKFCIETLETKNLDFESKISKLEKELSVLKRLKMCLESKILELAGHVSDVFAKLTSKDEELNKIVRELGDQKQASESELGKVYEMYEQANKTIASLENERGNVIDQNNREISSLKGEINNLNDKIYELNAKEVDYLHDLKVTKSELNVAFEKYTQTFDEQQELKSEYEIQIKNLTENLHEVVTKYNQLEKSQQSNTSELEMVNKCLEELKDEKVTLEIKIIEQKKQFDQEIGETNEQFNVDFKQLTTKHGQVEQALMKAKSDLEQQIGIQYRLQGDVKKLIIKLNEVEGEKAELLQKIDTLESTRFKLEDDYKQLKLTYEDYILTNQSDLEQREMDVQNEICTVNLAKEQLDRELKALQGNISILEGENQRLQRQIEDDQGQYQTHLSELRCKMQRSEATNARIIEEQNNLRAKISNYHDENEIAKRTSLEQTDVISKLKSAYDILQTGKERVELDLKNVQEQLRNLQNQYVGKEAEMLATLTRNEEDLRKLTEDYDAQTISLNAKLEELSNLHEKLRDLQRVNEAMRFEMDALVESNDSREMMLNKIDEENLQTIKEISREFEELKSKYEEVSSEAVSLRNNREELMRNIENSSKSMCGLQKIIESKDKMIEELKIKLNEIWDGQLDKESVIKELSEELRDTVDKLIQVKNQKLKLDVDLEEARMEIDRWKRSREDILEAQHKIIKETEDNILRAHANAIDVKNDLLMSIETAKEDANFERSEKLKLHKLLEEERAGVRLLEIGLLNMKNEKSKLEQIHFVLKKCVSRLYEVINSKVENFDNIDEEHLEKVTVELETNIVETYRRSRELSDAVSKLQAYESESHTKLLELENERMRLNKEKDELLRAYNEITEKNQLLLVEKSQEKEEMQKEISNLMNSQIIEDVDTIKTENEVLHQTVISLKDKNIKAYNIYNEFSETSKSFKTIIDKILKDRNTLDASIIELRQSLVQIQTKYSQSTCEFSPKNQEQKVSFEYIVDDIQKQFNRYSKIAYNVAYNNVQIYEKVMQGILSEKYLDWNPLLKELNIDEVSIKFEELQERTTDTLEQLRSFEEVLDKSDVKNVKVLKENVSKTGPSDLKKDEEWRKKYTALRQKLTLTENVKNNYEKKVRQLREENKKIASEGRKLDEDASYKILLQQHIQAKEEFEKKVSELKGKYQKLQNDYLELKRQKAKPEEGGQFDRNEKEIQAVREAYGKVMTDNAKLELESTTLRKVIEDKKSELAELSLVREAYEKLLEEHSKMMTEVDTLKYKRSRDKEDFMHLLMNEREEREMRENKKIQHIRAEYEGKLESMKSKMLNLYKEEIDKEARKLTADKTNYDLLKLELEDSKRTIEQLKMSQKFDLLGSRESLGALSIKSECDVRDVKNLRARSVQDSRKGSWHTLRSGAHDRRYATLPRSMGVIEESNKTLLNAVPPDLGQNLEMEDEGELFNNKYLADLKAGRCVVGPTTDDSRFSRVSELAWRNSLCPPHLKSSYPAELQFASPTRFKEEDIKTGNIELDDSLSTKLLPGEKSRKKDIGTTSYKKPGPPTPSKNGGRLSLQSNELQPFKDVQDLEAKTPKRATPGRIKAFFLGLNSTTKNTNSENQASTPKPRTGTRIFRKAR